MRRTPDVATGAVSSYLTVSPLPRSKRDGFISVALSLIFVRGLSGLARLASHSTGRR